MRWLVLLLLLLATPAQARLQASQTPGKYHEWFEGQYAVGTIGTNAMGLPIRLRPWCCNISDGFVLEDNEWGANNDGTFWVEILHKRYVISPEQLVDPAGNPNVDKPTGGPNPVGAAIVWYVVRNSQSDYGVSIYCFCPGVLY